MIKQIILKKKTQESLNKFYVNVEDNIYTAIPNIYENFKLIDNEIKRQIFTILFGKVFIWTKMYEICKYTMYFLNQSMK